MTAQLDSGLKTTQVYTNTLLLEPEHGMSQVVSELASWIAWKTSEEMTAEMILSGKESYLFGDESEFLIELGQFEGVESSIPMALKASYIHDDPKTEGRQWITEVELFRELADFTVEFSVNLYVVDAHLDVRPPMPSRPRLLVNVTETCRPVGATPGLYTRALTTGTAEKFLAEVITHSRKVPIVVISSNWAMEPGLNVERMREQLLGLANLYAVPEETDSWELASMIGKGLTCYGDAIRIIWPLAEGQADPSSVLVLPKGKDDRQRTAGEMERIAVLVIMRKRMEDALLIKTLDL